MPTCRWLLPMFFWRHKRLGVSTKSIYTWQRQFSQPAKVIQEVDAQADEIRRLKRDLARLEGKKINHRNRVNSLDQRTLTFQPRR